MKRSYVCTLVMLVALLALGITSARADIISFNLDTGNSAISGFTGPYATVTIDRTSSTTATITFDSLTNGGNIYLLGDGGTVGINVDAASWTIGSITGANSGTGFTPGPYSDGGAGNEDGFGSFNQTINSFDGFTHSSDTVSFLLTDTSGSWASAGNVLTGNGAGNLAAAHIFVTSSPADASNTALATGFASGNGAVVPEPNFVLVSLASLGLVILFNQRRRRA